MSRQNKKKSQPQPLYTINQKPGKEDSSFIGPDDQYPSMTTSLPLSSQIQPISNQSENPVTESAQKKKQTQKVSNKEEKVRANNKKKHQSETDSKIHITSQSFDIDFKLVSQAFDQHLKESIPKWMQQDNLTQDQLNLITTLLQQAKKQAFEKVIHNVEIVGDKPSKQQIIPIQVSLGNNIYRLNQMNLENLKIANERVSQEKHVRQQIDLNPQTPNDSQVQVLMEDGSIIMLDEYIKLQATKNLDKQTQQFQEYEKFVLTTQKNFVQCVSMAEKINNQLADELRVLDQGKKRGNLFRFK